MSKLLDESAKIQNEIHYVISELEVMADAYYALGMEIPGRKCRTLAKTLEEIPERLSNVVGESINESYIAAEQGSANLFKALLYADKKPPQVGDRVELLEEVIVGPYGTIPKGSIATYRGRSNDLENYYLFGFHSEFSFLETAYGVPNCYLGEFDEFKVISEDN